MTYSRRQSDSRAEERAQRDVQITVNRAASERYYGLPALFRL
jgi:hypothetical protein